jgi:hypothetical protein
MAFQYGRASHPLTKSSEMMPGVDAAIRRSGCDALKQALPAQGVPEHVRRDILGQTPRSMTGDNTYASPEEMGRAMELVATYAGRSSSGLGKISANRTTRQTRNRSPCAACVELYDYRQWNNTGRPRRGSAVRGGHWDIPYQHQAEAVEPAFRPVDLCAKSFQRAARRQANIRLVRAKTAGEKEGKGEGHSGRTGGITPRSDGGAASRRRARGPVARPPSEALLLPEGEGERALHSVYCGSGERGEATAREDAEKRAARQKAQESQSRSLGRAAARPPTSSDPGPPLRRIPAASPAASGTAEGGAPRRGRTSILGSPPRPRISRPRALAQAWRVMEEEARRRWDGLG